MQDYSVDFMRVRISSQNLGLLVFIPYRVRCFFEENILTSFCLPSSIYEKRRDSPTSQCVQWGIAKICKDVSNPWVKGPLGGGQRGGVACCKQSPRHTVKASLSRSGLQHRWLRGSCEGNFRTLRKSGLARLFADAAVLRPWEKGERESKFKQMACGMFWWEISSRAQRRQEERAGCKMVKGSTQNQCQAYTFATNDFPLLISLFLSTYAKSFYLRHLTALRTR